MAATKLIRKLISSVVKKKKKKNPLQESVEDTIKIRTGKKKPKTRQEVINSPRRKMKKSEGTLQGKRVTQEKAPSKKTKAKPMNTAAKKAAGEKALKSIPKKAKSSKPQNAMSMKTARKKQMRDTANLDSEMKRLGRKYDDLPKGVKRTILMAIKSKDPTKIKKAMRGTNMTASEFVKVFNKRGKI